MTRTQLHAFLSSQKLAVLSTVNAAGHPQSALIGMAVTADLEIVFDTVKSSRKYPNLTTHPSCSLVAGWSGEQTLQYEGIARELAGSELARYQKTYFETWPECIPHQSWPGIVYFAVEPRWLRFSDFDQRPPLISELEFTRPLL